MEARPRVLLESGAKSVRGFNLAPVEKPLSLSLSLSLRFDAGGL